MKTKLLKKIRKVFLFKYTLDYNGYHKQLILFNKKNSSIKKNRWEGTVITPTDLEFVLRELGDKKLLNQYLDKKSYIRFKKL